MENGYGTMKRLLVLSRFYTVINLIMTRPTKSNTIADYISKLWVISPIFGVMTYSLATLKYRFARLTSIIVTLKYFVSKLIIFVAISVPPISVLVHRVASTSSYLGQVFRVSFIRARFRAILPVLQSMFWSVESIVTKLASFGVLVHQYNYILNKGLSK